MISLLALSMLVAIGATALAHFIVYMSHPVTEPPDVMAACVYGGLTGLSFFLWHSF